MKLLFYLYILILMFTLLRKYDKEEMYRKKKTKKVFMKQQTNVAEASSFRICGEPASAFSWSPLSGLHNNGK